MRRLWLSSTLLLGLLLAAPVASHAASGDPLCGTRSIGPRIYDHVIWIIFENHGYAQIIGSPAAPYTNTLAQSCSSATNFHNISHFSLDNYIGMVTGLGLSELAPFFLDCNPGVNCSTPVESIFSQASSWKAYNESMPSNCAASGFSPYGVRHNPPVYLTSLAAQCSTLDVPYTELQTDLDANTLPAFAFVVPNNINNGHDGGDPGAIQNGDNWLSTELPKILDSQAYQNGKTVIFITWDEGEFGAGFSIGENCASKTNTDESCHVPLIVVSPSARAGRTTNAFFTHYSLLRTTERLLGIHKYLGLAKKAPTFRYKFGL